jgi:type III secretion protein J
MAAYHSMPRQMSGMRIRLGNRLLKVAAERLSLVFLLLLVCLLCACSKSVDLQTGLNNSDANEIVTVLNRNGIEAQKHLAKDGVTLSVQEADISRATEAMQAAGLPRRSLSNLGQMFKREGMISTPLEERVRYIYGLSSELEFTLQQFDHVVGARVHVVLPERIAPGEPIQPSSAAVFIKYRGTIDEDVMIPRVRNLVAGSIPGLSGEDARSKISVVLVAAEASVTPVEWTTVGPFRVQRDSAGTLTACLISLLILGPLALLLLPLVLKKYIPQVSALLKNRLGTAKKAKPAPAGKPAA